jgi:glutaredoxin
LEDKSNSPQAEENTDASQGAIKFDRTARHVTVFGRRSCGLTTRMMSGLKNNNIPYIFENVDSRDGKAHLYRRMEQTGKSRNRYMLPVIYMNEELMYSPQLITVVMKYQNNSE